MATPHIPLTNVLSAELAALADVQRWVVALSGGLDSMVLLDLMCRTPLNVPVVAVHVNHQLSPNALVWQDHCANQARARAICCYSFAVDLTHAGEGIEAAARTARYGVFEDFLQPGDVLLQAHHLDDQVETFFLRLLRGAGPKGLAGMPKMREVGRARLLRPLLTVRRAVLEAYARQQHLVWVEDESNAETHFDRNYLRHEVLPVLAQRWPDLPDKVLSAAQLCAQADTLQSEQAAADLVMANCRPERLGQSAELAYLLSLGAARRFALLRYWCEAAGLSTPSQEQLMEVEKQFFQLLRADSEACVSWGKTELRRFRDRLYLLPSLGLEEPFDQQSQTISQLVGGEKVHVRLNQFITLTLCPDILAPARLRADITALDIQRRRGGERCKPAGRKHSQTLKKLLQEYDLEPWLRGSVPLLYHNGELAAVGDLWVCDGFVAQAGQAGYRLDWRVVSRA